MTGPVQLSQGANDILELIANRARFSNTGIRIEYEYAYGVHRGHVANPEEIKLAHRKRVIMEQFSNCS